MLPVTEQAAEPKRLLHPAYFVAAWICLSSITILFNKYIFSDLSFPYPATLTCWHLLFSSIATQILARTTTLLDARYKVKMTAGIYLRAIAPIGLFYSLSLFTSNQAYLYLSVSFVQMLKAGGPFFVLIMTWIFRVADPQLSILLNVLIIVFGVAIASYGEIKFVMMGFIYQMGGLVFEALRLTLIQVLLSGAGQKMDPLVSLYYYAPVCTVMNFLVATPFELRSTMMEHIWRVGIPIFVLNAGTAFLLNVASVLLIGRTSGLVLMLCGVLKNILLVVASILIWGDLISGMQIFGYVIASAGLVYYGIGPEGMRGYIAASQEHASKLWKGGAKSVSSWSLPYKIMLVSVFATIGLTLAMLVVHNRGAEILAIFGSS